MKRDDPALWLQFTDPRAYTVIALALLVLVMAVSMWVENSRFGLLLTAIKQNELAARAAGIDPRRWKTAALVLSGALAGASGGFYACVLLVVTLFGGIGTYWGPLIGAAILIPMSEMLQAELGEVVPGIQGVAYGAAIIAIMLAAPEGLFWFLRDRRARREEPQAAPAPVPASPVPMPAPTGRPMLEVTALGKSFGGLRAVDDVSFSVGSGRILGIIGPNGAGKTTLFNVVNGVLAADRGQALLDGETLVGRKLHEICRLGVGRTFQVVRSFPRLPLLDNVLAGAELVIIQWQAGKAVAVYPPSIATAAPIWPKT